MDRESLIRMMLAMVVCLVLVMGYMHLRERWQPSAPPAPQAATSGTGAAQPGPQPAQPAAQPPAKTPEQPPAPAEGPNFTVLSTKPESVADYQGLKLGDSSYLGQYALAVQLTAQGAGIRHLELSDYFASVDDLDKSPDERRKFQLVQADKGQPGFVITRLDVLEKDSTQPRVIETELPSAWWTLEEPPATAGGPTVESAKFKLDIQKDGQPYLTLRKTFVVHPRTAGAWSERFGDGRPYAVELELRAEDRTADKSLVSVAVTLRGPEGLVREEPRGEDRLAIAGFANPDERAATRVARDAGDAKKRDFSPGRPGDWAGMVDKYFGLVAVADPKDALSRFEKTVVYEAYKENGTALPGVLMTSYQKPFEGPGRTAGLKYLLFAGPKDKDLLEQPIFRERCLVHLVQWSSGCCVLPELPGVKQLAQIMVWAIDAIARLVANKGIAVIILVILMRLVLFPVSRYTTVSMLKMQDLQPELNKIKAEFKDDKQRQQLEQMKVMRERGVNPLMGCLPMALQMPFWIALYTGIQVAISLRQAPLLPFWIVDLSRPDALMTFQPAEGAIIGFIGNWANWQLNVLPLLMLVAFFLQTQLQPQPGGTSPEMERQQKLMKYLMPGFMFFLFYSMPSALNLYIMASSVMGYAETRFVRWHYAQMKLRPPKPRRVKPKNFFSRWMEQKFEDLHKLQERAHKSEPSWDKKKRDKNK